MLIYTLVFMVLFQFAMAPLRQFFLQTASRSAALLYVQLRHADGRLDTETDLVRSMVPGSNLEAAIEARGSGRTTTDRPLESSAAKALVEYYIRYDLFGDTKALPGKLFDRENIKIDIQDTQSTPESFWQRLTGYFKNAFSTQQVSVTISYNQEFVQGFSGSAWGTWTITGHYECRYAP